MTRQPVTRHGGRRREYLSVREEQQLASYMRARISAGKVKTVKDLDLIVRRKVRKETGKEISPAYIYRFLERNGFEIKPLRVIAEDE